MKTKHIYLSLVLLLGVYTASFNYIFSDEIVQAFNGACPTTFYISKPSASETISGNVNFEVTLPSEYSPGSVAFQLDGNTGLPAYRVSSTLYRTNNPFNTTTRPDGAHSMYAALSGGNVGTCVTNSRSFSIDNTPTSPPPDDGGSGGSGGSTTPPAPTSLEVIKNAQKWEGLTNTPYDFVLSVKAMINGVMQDVTSQASYNWSTNIGALNSQGNSAHFSSGSNPGNGEVKIHVEYGGLKQDVSIPVYVLSAEQTSTYPSTTNSDGTITTAPTSQLSGAPTTIGLTESPKEGDSTLELCLVRLLGEDVYRERIQNHQRLSYEELKKAKECFDLRRSIIPANLAPVDPAKVRQLPERPKLVIHGIKSVKVNDKETIELSGVADPNKTVVIYIFSEPLVLSAQTDNDGKWSYTLEDPMEPGEHEAYVTVEGEDAQPVRSSLFGFAVLPAEKTKENPFGLSFAIKDSEKNKFYTSVYVIGAAAFIAVAGAISLLLLKRRRHIQVTGSSPVGVTSVGTSSMTTPLTGDPMVANLPEATPQVSEPQMPQTPESNDDPAGPDVPR